MGLLDEYRERGGLLDEYLSDLLYDTRSKTRTAGLGPVTAYAGEQRPAMTDTVHEPTNPTRTFGVDARIGSGLVTGNAGLSAMVDPRGDTTLTPRAGIGIGPLSLNAMIDRRHGPEGVVNTPRYGAALDLPIGGGNATFSASITPREILQIAAQYKISLKDATELAFQINHSRTYDGRPPDWRAGFAIRKEF